jgi:hypothetical protein
VCVCVCVRVCVSSCVCGGVCLGGEADAFPSCQESMDLRKRCAIDGCMEARVALLPSPLPCYFSCHTVTQTILIFLPVWCLPRSLAGANAQHPCNAHTQIQTRTHTYTHTYTHTHAHTHTHTHAHSGRCRMAIACSTKATAPASPSKPTHEVDQIVLKRDFFELFR